MEQYMSKTRGNYGSGVARPKINGKTHFELKEQFLKELRENTFSGSEHEDANEHIKKVLEIVNLFHIPKVTQDQIMLRAFPMSLTRAASRWLRNDPSGSITNWETLKMKFLNKYCPPARTAKKMEEINNFQQEPDESLFRAWERFKELLMKCPQHYLTDMQEVILFYNGLDVPTRHILDLKGVIPTKTVADAKVAIQEMAEYSQKWHNRTSSKARSTKTSDGLAVIQAQLNNLGIEIKKVNEKVYAAQVGCELCKGPHYTKDCPLEEKGKSLEEAYYTQFGAPYQPGGQYRAAGPGFYQRNNENSSYPDQRQTLEESLTKFMAESTKRHEENSNIIKEIRASTDATIRNQGASIKTLEIQIANSSVIRRIGSVPYAVSDAQYNSLSSETVPFPNRLHGYCCDNWKEPFVDLGASVSVMPFSTYSHLGLGDLAHTRLTIELADRTIKHPKGIAENVLVRIGKFILRVEEEKLVFKSVKPATSIIRRVYMVKERSDLKFVGEAINESFEPLYGNYIELNDLDLPLEPRTNQDDFEPTPDFVNEPACFSITNDIDITSDVVLGMPFCKKFLSCQKIMERFTHGDKCERMDE
ncbi:hypothetical protein Tco_0236454 [Tanacetum coccineum]